jgi:hypothetical protein
LDICFSAASPANYSPCWTTISSPCNKWQNHESGFICENTQTNLDLRNATLGYGFHFQQINSRTFPVESFAHDSGRIGTCPIQLSEGISKHQQLQKKSVTTTPNTAPASEQRTSWSYQTTADCEVTCQMICLPDS